MKTSNVINANGQATPELDLYPFANNMDKQKYFATVPLTCDQNYFRYCNYKQIAHGGDNFKLFNTTLFMCLHYFYCFQN